jgi:hypothetical protein
MWQTPRSAQLTTANRAWLGLVAILVVIGGPLPSGNGASIVSPRFEDYLVSNVYRARCGRLILAIVTGTRGRIAGAMVGIQLAMPTSR